MSQNGDIAQRVVHRMRTAALQQPFQKEGPPMPPAAGGGGDRRNIPQDHPFDAAALKPMAKTLWAASVSLGHALTAFRHLNRLKSATISPDGMLGGRGYIISVKDLRQMLYAACESLSTITDTLHDELQAPHWKPKLAQLDQNDQEDVARFVEESKHLLDDPEKDAEEEIEEIEEENDGPDDKKEPEASALPEGGSSEESEARPPPRQKEASLGSVADLAVHADSSVDPDTLPGPRVDSLDRAEQTGPWGSFNKDEIPSDDWDSGEGGYTYNYEGENDLREAATALPEDDTSTQAWDFGLGFGAHGQGAGGYENPSDEAGATKGVWGPHSALPGSSNTSVNDTTPIVDVQLNERHAWLNLPPGSLETLPGDPDEPVARSDYFPGPKGNLVQGESELPQAVTPVGENAPSMVDTFYVSEDLATPYTRYDYTTHTYRDDPLHNWPQTPSQG